MILELALALTLEQAASLYAVAYGQYGSRHGGMPPPDKAPVIKEVSQEELKQVYGCECNINGVQFADQIMLNEALDYGQPYGAAVLVHEYIHYFQYIRFGPPVDCMDFVSREHEAYLIQIAMLERAGLEAMGVRVAARSLRCAPQRPVPGVAL